MKKLIALVLALLLVFGMTACQDTGNIRGDITSDSNSTEGSSEKEFSTGKVSANKYVNTFAGISCQLGSQWKFMTDAEIEKNNKDALGLVGDNYAELMKNANTFTDMMATHSNQTDTVNIIFEKLTGTNAVMTEEKYVELSKDSLKGALESMGMTKVTTTTGKANFAGKEHPFVAVAAEYNGTAVYERIAVVKCSGYMVVVTACTWKTDGCKAVLDQFKAA